MVSCFQTLTGIEAGEDYDIQKGWPDNSLD